MPGLVSLPLGLHPFGLINVVCLEPFSLYLGWYCLGLIDAVCLEPVSLFPGLSSCGWFDVVCLGLSSAHLGCLLCGNWCGSVYAWCLCLPWFGLSLYLPHAVACLSTILFPWLTVVARSNGELLGYCVWFSQVVVIMCIFSLAHPSILVNLGNCAKLSIQDNVILQMLFLF